MNPSYRQRRLRIWAAVGAGVISLVLFLYFYQFPPFPEGVTDFITSGMIVIAALIAAMTATFVTRRYKAGTPPRLIWLHFTLAVLGWAIGEAIWLHQFMTGGPEAASLSLADVFWVLSYFLFIVSLYRQYSLIYRPKQSVAVSYLTLAIIAVLMFTYLYGIWLLSASPEANRLETFVNGFYAVGDFALAVGALVIAIAFRDGALGRPWMGLLVFAFSDLLYAWLESSGLYAWSIEQGNLLTTITDASYFAAYLVIAFGCYLQLILLTFGPRLKYDQ